MCAGTMCCSVFSDFPGMKRKNRKKPRKFQVIADTEEEVVDKEELDYEDPQSTGESDSR